MGFDKIAFRVILNFILSNIKSGIQCGCAIMKQEVKVSVITINIYYHVYFE
jgi:hypothetical protein